MCPLRVHLVHRRVYDVTETVRDEQFRQCGAQILRRVYAPYLVAAPEIPAHIVGSDHEPVPVAVLLPDEQVRHRNGPARAAVDREGQVYRVAYRELCV